MKRILEYINNHPKLKRFSKILVIVAILFSFLFNALIIGSLIINANNHQDYTQELSYMDNNTSKKAYITSNYEYYFFTGDILTTNFLEGFYQEYQKLHDPEENFADITQWVYSSVGANWTYFFNGSNQAVQPLGYLLPFNAVDYYNASTFYNSYYEVYSVKFTLTAKDNYTLDNGLRMTGCKLTINFNNADLVSLSTHEIRIYYYFDSSNNIKFYSSMAYTPSSAEVFLVNSNIGNTILKSMVTGNSLAYDLGYAEGYKVGTSDIALQNDGVFGLLAQAFNSVANIFNITILPGFTIGTLIAIPLIVMVIIVLFKMFRG